MTSGTGRRGPSAPAAVRRARRPTDAGGARAAFAFGIEGSVIGDRIYSLLVTFFALLRAGTPAVLIAVEIARAGWPAFQKFGLSFLTSSRWDPVNGVFGAAPAIYGTLVSSLVALILATPLALGVAVFLSEFAPAKLRQPIAFLVDLLAAIPSVVYGLWGIFVLLPVLRTSVMPFLRDTLHLGVLAAVLRARIRTEHARGRADPRDHGPALHLVGVARGVAGRPALAA